MKILFTCLILVFCGLFLAACNGGKIFGGSWITERYAGIPDALFYQTKGSCDDGSFVFRILAGGGAILWDVPQTQSENDILTGQIQIYLNRDGTYTANYKEHTFHALAYEEQFSSLYTFDSETQILHFYDLGTAMIVPIRHRYFLRLTLNKNLNSSFLRGQTIELWLQSSEKGLDTDRTQYCSQRS